MYVYFQEDDPCLTNPCFYGTCKPQGPTQYICDCLTGYTGTHCDTGTRSSSSLLCYVYFQLYFTYSYNTTSQHMLVSHVTMQALCVDKYNEIDKFNIQMTSPVMV